MRAAALERFIAQAVERSRAPADCVLALAPLMLELIDAAGSFLEPRHYRSEPGHYARNLVYDASNPGPIHVTGVPAERLPAVSLHLYGRTMNRFNIYDPAAGTRRAIDVAHNES